MKAYQISRQGNHGPLVLNDVDKPKTHANKILVKVHAASMNPLQQRLRNHGQVLTAFCNATRA